MRPRARDFYLELAHSWNDRSRALDTARFKLWQASTGFPQSGWSRSSPPLNAHCVNLALGPLLPWHSANEQDVSDIRYLLDFKARQLAGTELSAIGASYLMQMLDQLRAEDHAHYFRSRLTELDPGWHQRGIPDNEAGYYLRKDQQLVEQLQVQHGRQEALNEREALTQNIDRPTDLQTPTQSRQAQRL